MFYTFSKHVKNYKIKVFVIAAPNLEQSTVYLFSDKNDEMMGRKNSKTNLYIHILF